MGSADASKTPTAKGAVPYRDWLGASVVMHPDAHDEYRRLQEFLEHLGFIEVDWCQWRMADGSLFEIYPQQPPPAMDVVHAEAVAEKTGEMPER